jgi:metallo-beta-lactamase class B
MDLIRVSKILFSFILSFNVMAQMPSSPGQEHPDRTKPVEPFHIIDNIYYIGTTVQSSSYLIAGSEGHVLFDTTYEDRVPMMVENIEKLGFNPKDVKLIIGTHAHSDHVGGHSLMQEMTGADILSSEQEIEVIETGGDGSWAPAEVNRIIKGGEVIQLGDIAVTAHFTPGHTQGTMTFTMTAEEDGQKYDVILLGGLRIATSPLIGNLEYPDIAENFSKSFEMLQKIPVDIFLGAHGYWYGLREKIVRMNNGEGYKVFIDPEGYRKAVDGWQQTFIDLLVTESKALNNK